MKTKQNLNLKTTGAIATALLVGTGAGMAEAAPRVLLNGQPLATSVAPMQSNGRTLVPMRDIFEALGASVNYNSLTRGIAAQRAGTAVQMQIGNRSANVNGRTVYLDQAPLVRRGSTLVPLRFVSEAMGANVQWQPSYNRVVINTTGGGNYTGGSQVGGFRTISVPAETVVPVILDQQLSSATARVGQTFTASVKSQRLGDSEFPAGSKIEGVVTEVQKRDGDDPGVLDMNFRAVVLPDGNRVPLNGRLIAMDDDSIETRADGRVVAKSGARSNDRLKIIGIGAAGGFLVGRLLKQNGALSAVLGAAGGYLFDRSRGGGTREAVVPAGKELGVRLVSGATYTDTTNYASQRANIRL